MNIVVIKSKSHILLEEEINKLIKDQSGKIIYNAEETSLENILEEASYVSMFDEMKYLVVKNANYFGSMKLKENEEKLLFNYLEQPYPMCTLIFTTYEDIDLRKKITKIVKEKYQLIDLPLLKGLELYNKVASLFIEKKYLAEKDVINYLINCCLGNYDLIYNEINKLDLYYNKPSKLKLDEVKQIISKTMADNNFKFVDAVMQKDIKKSFHLLDELITLKVEPLSLLNLLTREIRIMLQIKLLEKKKIGVHEGQKILHLQDWQYEKSRRNASGFHEDDLKDHIVALEKMDVQIKKGNLDKLLSIKMFLLDFFEYET